ncbi:MAG: hypothetical protein OXT68_12410 [Chloroflexota bacterium]|nr:hypothetical protein [Chloroflexota bacterium]
MSKPRPTRQAPQEVDAYLAAMLLRFLPPRREPFLLTRAAHKATRMAANWII